MENVCVTVKDIDELFHLARKSQYDARNGEEESIDVQKKCEKLFEKDYICCKVENEKGALTPNYPAQLIIPVAERITSTNNLLNESSSTIFDPIKYKEIVSTSYLARHRKRFPVPVIFYNEKFVCRSATLVYGGEMLPVGVQGLSETSKSEEEKSVSNTSNHVLCNQLRSHDKNLLEELHIEYICDYIQETPLAFKGLKARLFSTEKLDQENRYSDFKLVQLPYPGCKIFTEFTDNNHTIEGLMFDWKQEPISSQVVLPSDSIISSMEIDWQNFETWDFIKITQNYLKLLLALVTKGLSGVLIHCRSGWDRAPLFTSLLRMSLWADGKIHKSLTAEEMAYLTLAYDWYLFGHKLPLRVHYKHEMMLFCFEILKYIASDEFSSDQSQAVNVNVESTLARDSSCCDRRARLDSIRTLVQHAYQKIVTENKSDYNSFGAEDLLEYENTL